MRSLPPFDFFLSRNNGYSKPIDLYIDTYIFLFGNIKRESKKKIINEFIQQIPSVDEDVVVMMNHDKVFQNVLNIY